MRIGIVDDRVLSSEALRRVIARVPEYRVAWIARDGDEAIRRCAADLPDLVLMDLVMPGVDGVEATRRIMDETPCPILVVTASLSENYTRVYDALAAGAIGAVGTPVLGADGSLKGADSLLGKIANVARRNRSTALPATTTPAPLPSRSDSLPMLCAIGASTGGPLAVAELLGEIPASTPVAFVVVQHITSDFSAGLAEWIQGQSRFPVRVARPGDHPRRGVALLAGENDHLVVRSDLSLDYTAHPVETPYRPSVDELFNSLAANWFRPGMGVLLTGMGRDGAEGLLRLRGAGWTTFAQDAPSSAVYGMPDAAVKLGAAIHVLPPAQIGRAILSHTRRFAGKGS